MKMSYIWVILFASNVFSLYTDITEGDFGLWFYLNSAGALACVYFFWEARQKEKREAEEKKQIINLFINHMDGESDNETAKRIAELKKLS